MKSTELKKLIKEAVKEAIGEEMRDILLEAVRSPKQAVYENQAPPPSNPTPTVDTGEVRTKYTDVLNGMLNEDTRNISMNSSHAQGFAKSPGYTPAPGANTSAQGSALPVGEVGMDQIMGLINKR